MGIFLMILVFSILSMIVYAVSSKEQPRQLIKSTIAGGVIACILSYPTWLWIGRDEIWLLIPITFVYTITGQFIPEFLQSIVPKFVKKITSIFYKQKTGEDLDNDH